MFTTIQAAVNAATDGDTIRVAQGAYTGMMSAPGTGTPFTATVLITRNLTLLGGYNADFSQRDPQAYTTTIDGQFQPWSVVGVLGCQATVDGFSIVNGRASDTGSGMWIGNWLGNSAVVTVSNNVVAYNKIVTDAVVTANGAGILVTQGATANILNNRIFSNAIESFRWYARPVAGLGVVSGATVVISGNQICANTVAFGNGGIGVSSATAQITNNTVQGNSGTGIDVYRSPSALIQGNTVVSNTALWNGGGIMAGESVVTITDNLIAYNVPSGNEGGGGVFLYGSSQGLIRQNQILFNQAKRGGGVVVIWGASGLIEENTIAYNRATYSGGGIEVRAVQQSGVVTISHNAVFSNVAREQGSINLIDLTTPTVIDGNDVRNNQITGESYWGGGINVENVSQPVTLTNNVVVSNHNRGVRAANVSLTVINNTIAQNGAMGVEVFRWPVTQTVPYTTTLVNNVVADHTGCGISASNGMGVIIDYSDVWSNTTNYCDLASPPSGTYNISADPQFVNPTAGDYHLRFGSPAMNAGTSVGAPAYDKEGVARPQGRGVDMGAYEVGVYDMYLPLTVKNH
jgi:parallel beta-helix repeat protein